MIILKIWCNFWFAAYVSNLALIEMGAIRFSYTITIYFLCFFPWLLLYYVYQWSIWCLLYLTYFRIIFWYLWIPGKCFSINRTKYLPIFLGRVFWKRRFEQDNGSFAIFGRLTFVLIFVIWWFVLRFVVKLRLIQDILIVFRCLTENFRIPGKVK